jgi:hypothetical protein
MSLGGDFDSAYAKERLERLTALADADRAAREAGRKSLFGRLRELLWPRRQEPGGPVGPA